MNMEVFKVIGIALIGTAAAVLVRPLRPELGMMIALGTGILIFASALGLFEQIQQMLNLMMENNGIDREHIRLLLKSLGICLVGQIASDSCKDSGEGAIAAKIELFCKLSVLLISFPLFAEIMEIAIDLLRP